MGRHAEQLIRARRRVGTVVVAVVAAVAVGVTGAAISSGAFPGTLAAVDAGCSAPVVKVTADPSIAPMLEAVADRAASEAAAADAGCATVTVTAQESADTAAVLASGAGIDADVWIPDSSVWVDRMGATASSLGRAAPEVEVRAAIASSPVVFAAPATRAEAFAADPISWATIMGGGVDALVPDPEANAASLAALSAMRGQVSAEQSRQFDALLLTLGRDIPETTRAAFASAVTAADPTVVITDEHSVAEYNGTEPDVPLVALYPSDQLVGVTYPFVRIDRGAGGQDDAATWSQIADFEFVLRSVGDDLGAAAFRDADGDGEITAPGIAPLAASMTPASDGTAQLEILRSWGVLTLRSRILSVIDVSGSMLDDAGNGLRRIDIFQQSAGGAIASFSGEVELGVWIFSTERAGAQDWEDLAPIAPLSNSDHTSAIGEIVASLPSRISGDTGLYDTTLAAVQRVREDFDPAMVNSVLLITDGRNDDDSGIDLPTLLAELQRIDDPVRPVPVIMIGFGPDTDIDAMRQIAAVTGGAAYTATEPADLQRVLVDAFAQRTCRPNC